MSLHGRPGRADRRTSSTCFTRARPREAAVHRRRSTSCWPRPSALFAELGLGDARDRNADAQSAARAARDRQPRRGLRAGAGRPGRAPSAICVALDADLIKDCGLIAFAKRFPTASSSAASPSRTWCRWRAGMARRGALPVVHSFACFLSARPNEQIYNQCSEGSKVIYVGSLAGLLPGGPGHSHQSVRDISALGGVPEPVAGRARAWRRRCTRSSTTLVNGAGESAYLRLVSVKWPVPFAYPVDHRRSRSGKGWVVARRRRCGRLRLRTVAARQCVRTRRRNSSRARAPACASSTCRG